MPSFTTTRMVLEKKIADGNILHLIQKFLQAGGSMQNQSPSRKGTASSHGIFYLSAFTIRMGDKAEDCFKDKVREITKRHHNLNQDVVIKLKQAVENKHIRKTGFLTCSEVYMSTS